jgi:hypothetical protein
LRGNRRSCGVVIVHNSTFRDHRRVFFISIVIGAFAIGSSAE